MPCDAMIFWLLGPPVLSTRDTLSNQDYSCWLSGWLSTSLNRGIRSQTPSGNQHAAVPFASRSDSTAAAALRWLAGISEWSQS
jgi:hypothetical protein